MPDPDDIFSGRNISEADTTRGSVTMELTTWLSTALSNVTVAPESLASVNRRRSTIPGGCPFGQKMR